MFLNTRFAVLVQATSLLFFAPVPFASAAAKYKTLHTFAYGEHYQIGGPQAPLLLGANGVVYGVAASGGVGCYGVGCGVVYSLSPVNQNRWRFSVLYEFLGASDGSFPQAGLIQDTSGNLFGTTIGSTDGTPSTVFELSPGSGGWFHTVLYTDGAGPGLLMDDKGSLYGYIGPGQNKGGAVGELSQTQSGWFHSTTWAYTDLYSFCGQNSCPDGVGLPSPPIWDGKGNLFGTTTDGGIGQPACYTGAGCGVIFEMTPNHDGTWTYHVLHRFASYPTDGESPFGGLVMDRSGNFYGTTEFRGPKGNGTVFKLAFTGGHWKKSVVYDFPNWHNGSLPNTTLVIDKAGSLYGAGGGGNQGCGPYTCGVVFKLSPQKSGTWKYSVVHKFSGPDGEFPWGVIVDTKGNVFGTTSAGGKYNSGVAFEITP